MPPSRRWIIGRGLLGSAVASARSDEVHAPRIDWSSAATATEDLRGALRSFLLDSGPHREIYWCAGRAVTASSSDDLDAEASVFERFLADLQDEVAGEPTPTRFFLASSAGGVYAGSEGTPFTEATPARPVSAYGRTKLRMEGALMRSLQDGALVALIARITNLYGPGQDLGKRQGLISAVVDSAISGRPATIYVPMDTLRDYVYVDDCARVIDAGMRRLADAPPGTAIVKIVGSMSAVSIGAVIGEVARLRRRPVPIILDQRAATGQAPDLRVRSTVWTDLDGLVATTLPEGLGAVHRSLLRRRMLPAG